MRSVTDRWTRRDRVDERVRRCNHVENDECSELWGGGSSALLSRRTIRPGLAAIALLLATALVAGGLSAQVAERGSVPGLTLTSDTPGELVISWSDPDPAPSDYRIGWAPVGEDYLSYSAENETGRGNAYPDGTARSYTVEGLPEGAEYKVQIRARFDQGGNNPWSGPWVTETVSLASAPDDTSETTTDPTTEPTPEPTPVASDVVTGLTLASDSAGELTASWSAPADSADDYRVVWSKVGESWPSWRDDDGNDYPTTTSLTITGLDPGAEYRLRVRARFGQNTSSPSSGPWTGEATHTVTAETTPPAPPTGLGATVVNGNVVLTWDDPEDDRITGYKIFGGLHETLITGLYNLHAGNGSVAVTYTDGRARAGVPNYYAVRPIAGDEATELSEVFSITPPAPPSQFMNPTVGESSITLAWEAPAGLSWDHDYEHYSGTAVTGYQLLRGDSLDTLAVLVEDTGNTGTTYTDAYTLGDGVVYYGLRTLSADGSSELAVQWAGTPPPDPNRHGAQWGTLVSNLNAGSGTTTTISAGGGALSQPFVTGPSEEGYELNTVRLRITPASTTTEVAVAVHADQGGSYGSRLFKLSSPGSLDGDFDDFTAPQGSMLEAGTTYWIVIRAVSGRAVLEVSTGTGTDDESMTGFALPAHTPPGNSGRSDQRSGNGSSTRSAANSAKGSTDGLQPRQQSNALRSVLLGRNAVTDLELNETVSSTIDYAGNDDRFKVNLEAGAMYLVSAQGGGYHRLQLDVYDDMVPPAVQDTDETNYFCTSSINMGDTLLGWIRDESELFFTPTTGGDYFIQVGSYQAETGRDYSLTVTEADPEAAGTSTTAEATPGVSYSGSLHVPYDADYNYSYQVPGPAGEAANFANYAPDTHDVDWVRLSGLQAGTTYTIILRGHPQPVNLQVTGMYDSAGTALSGFGAVNSYSPEYHNSKLRIFFTPETSGDHYIELTARSAGGDTDCIYNSRGLSYTLELWEPADAPLAITASATTAVTDGTDYPELDGARGIATHTIGSNHYAIVAASEDDGFQIINITDPSSPTDVADETDGENSFTALDGATSVATHTIGNKHYAIITAVDEDGVQIVDITTPSDPTAVAAIFDAGTDINGDTFDALNSPWHVATHTIADRHYALVVAEFDDAVQIIDITTPSSPTAVAAIVDGATDASSNTFEELDGPNFIAVHTIGNKHYALVAAYDDDGVQIIDITNPARPTAVSHVTDGQDGFDELNGAASVATHTIGGRHYALVASEFDDGVQIIDFTNPRKPTAAASVTDGQDGFDRLDGAFDITTVTILHQHYALVAASTDDAMQIIDITDPTDPQPVTALVDDEGGFATLDVPRSVAVHAIDGRYYGLAAAFLDDGVQIFELEYTLPSEGHLLVGNTHEGDVDESLCCQTLYAFATTAVTTDPIYPELGGAWGIATHTIGNNHYAIVAGWHGSGFQIINITDPSDPTAEADETDGQNGFTALLGANYVATHTIGNRHYALITASSEHGVQIVDITTPSSPTAVTAIFDGDTDANGVTFDRLDSAGAIATHTIGNRHYALAVAGSNVQIIDITNPHSPTAVAGIGDGQLFAELNGARDIAVHTIGNKHYALVAAITDDGVQIIDITNPAIPTAVAHMTDGQNGFDTLDGASGIAVHTIGGRHYALVAAFRDGGVQIIDFTDPEEPTAAGSVPNSSRFLDHAIEITTVTIRHRHYALVPTDQSVKIIDFTDPTDPQRVTALVDDEDGFTTLRSPRVVAVHAIDGRYYGLATAFLDHGVQIFELASNDGIATEFTAGKGHSGQPYVPTSVELEFLSPSTNIRPVVSLHADDNGQPWFEDRDAGTA